LQKKNSCAQVEQLSWRVMRRSKIEANNEVVSALLTKEGAVELTKTSMKRRSCRLPLSADQDILLSRTVPKGGLGSNQ